MHTTASIRDTADLRRDCCKVREAIKAPGFGERRTALLQDIAIVTGSTFFAKYLGMGVASATLDTLVIK